jgi:hypothetical protein
LAPRHPAETGAERRSARRGWTAAGLTLTVCVAATVVLALWAGRGEFATHWAHLLGRDAPRIALDLAALAPNLDAAALQQRLALATLHCQAADNASGVRVCDAALAQANGVPAARLRATLAPSGLRQLELFVPWWAHHRAARALTAQQGAPVAVAPQAPGPASGRELVWAAGAGTVTLAASPGWNPWRWSVLRWAAVQP